MFILSIKKAAKRMTVRFKSARLCFETGSFYARSPSLPQPIAMYRSEGGRMTQLWRW